MNQKPDSPETHDRIKHDWGKKSMIIYQLMGADPQPNTRQSPGKPSEEGEEE